MKVRKQTVDKLAVIVTHDEARALAGEIAGVTAARKALGINPEASRLTALASALEAEL